MIASAIGVIINISSAFLYENREKMGFPQATNQFVVSNDCIQSVQKVTELNFAYIEALGYIDYVHPNTPIALDEIEKHLRKEIEFLPDNGWVMGSLGWICLKKGLYAEAITFLKKATTLVPSVSIIEEHLGDAYEKMNQYNLALIAYEQALSNLKEIEKKKSNNIAYKIEKLKKDIQSN